MKAADLHNLLGAKRWVALATSDGDQPRVRMMTVRCHGGRVWCFTSASSAKARQIEHNDKFELVANMGGEKGVSSLRAMGRVRIIEDAVVKKELERSCESFRDHWASSEDPDFMLLRLDVVSVETEEGPDTKAERFVIE